jgi:hypothetical protein
MSTSHDPCETCGYVIPHDEECPACTREMLEQSHEKETAEVRAKVNEYAERCDKLREELSESRVLYRLTHGALETVRARLAAFEEREPLVQRLIQHIDPDSPIGSDGATSGWTREVEKNARAVRDFPLQPSAAPAADADDTTECPNGDCGVLLNRSDVTEDGGCRYCLQNSDALARWAAAEPSAADGGVSEWLEFADDAVPPEIGLNDYEYVALKGLAAEVRRLREVAWVRAVVASEDAAEPSAADGGVRLADDAMTVNEAWEEMDAAVEAGGLGSGAVERLQFEQQRLAAEVRRLRDLNARLMPVDPGATEQTTGFLRAQQDAFREVLAETFDESRLHVELTKLTAERDQLRAEVERKEWMRNDSREQSRGIIQNLETENAKLRDAFTAVQEQYRNTVSSLRIVVAEAELRLPR